VLAGTATGDVHIAGLNGGRFDTRGKPGQVYALLSAPRVAVNARFDFATFRLPSSDPRSLVIKMVHGSIMSEAYIVMRLPSKSVACVGYMASVPHVASVQLSNDGSSTFNGDTRDIFLDMRDSMARADVENIMHVTVVPTPRKSFALHVTDGTWAIQIIPMSYLNVRGSYDRRIDVKITPTVVAVEDSVAPHGLIGQSLHDYFVIRGKLDIYLPNAAGEFTTSAQGEGAIEGTMEDYEIHGNPYSTDFHFSRFGSTTANPHNVTQPAGHILKGGLPSKGGDAVGDSPPLEEPTPF